MFQYVWHDEDLPLLKAPIKGLNFQPFTSSYECNTFLKARRYTIYNPTSQPTHPTPEEKT